ncbi:hypothetical protein ACJX0J_029362, partial [Zea mays]
MRSGSDSWLDKLPLNNIIPITPTSLNIDQSEMNLGPWDPPQAIHVGTLKSHKTLLKTSIGTKRLRVLDIYPIAPYSKNQDHRHPQGALKLNAGFHYHLVLIDLEYILPCTFIVCSTSFFLRVRS